MKFVIVGGVAAVANFGSRIALSLVMPYVPAIFVAYLIGMATAFLLNRRFVFGQAGTSLRHQAFWFTAVNIAAVLQTIVVSLLFARWIFPAINMQFQSETIAHGIGVMVPVFTSYLGHKAITFRETAR